MKKIDMTLEELKDFFLENGYMDEYDIENACKWEYILIKSYSPRFIKAYIFYTKDGFVVVPFTNGYDGAEIAVMFIKKIDESDIEKIKYQLKKLNEQKNNMEFFLEKQKLRLLFTEKTIN